MKFKTLLMAFVLSISSITSFATSTDTYAVVGPSGSSFSEILGYDLISLSGTSDISGLFSYSPTTSDGFNLIPVTFTGFSLINSVTSTAVASVSSASSFSFLNVAAGSYYLAAAGTLGALPARPRSNYASISADYSVTPVPEPKTSGMFLAGLGIIGFIASRRKSLI